MLLYKYIPTRLFVWKGKEVNIYLQCGIKVAKGEGW